MKKIFIITYSFPPHNNTASQRPLAWAKYMKGFGLYPIIITRNTDEDAIEKVEVEENDSYTVYRVKTSKILQLQLWDAKSKLLVAGRKLLNLVDLFFHASYLFGPYKDLRNVAKSVIESTDSEKVLICTAMPFGLLKVGHDLHKSTGIKWIADYRDDWTTYELPKNSWIKSLLFNYLYPFQERSWVSSATMITSVSDHYVNKIVRFIDKPNQQGLVVENGFFDEEHRHLEVNQEKYKNLTFVYVGSLYISQNIEALLEAILEATTLMKDAPQVDFIFLGTSLSKARKEGLIKSFSSHKINLIFYNRLPKTEALEIQSKCHYAVICPHTNLKGVPSSKLYEFIGSRMQVIYFPNDNDIIDRNLSMCELGVSASSKKELIVKLTDIFNNYQTIELKGNTNYQLFSRENSTRILAEGILDLL